MSSSTGIVWLNTAETARRLGVTPRTLYRFIDEGQLPAYRFGRVIRLKETEVEQFIEDCRIAPGTLDADTRYSDDETQSETTAVESSIS
jgi:excisionase family DNA binding protein